MLLESIMKKYGYYNHYNKPLNELSVGGESIDDIDDDNFELNDNENLREESIQGSTVT